MTSGHQAAPGLIHDIPGALERHGHYRSDDLHAGRAIGLIGDPACTCEGTQDHPAYPRTMPPPAPAYPRPSRHDAITLTRAVFAALDIAADDKRYRAGMCTGCPGQPCPARQTRRRDAQAFDQLADRMLQAAQATSATSASQPAPDRGSQPAAGREAGQ